MKSEWNFWDCERNETMSNLWTIAAQRFTVNGSWTGSVQVPIFFLNGNVQGIVNHAQAARIASDILDFQHGGSVVVVSPENTAESFVDYV